MRQASDPDFVQFLNLIQNQVPTQAKIDHCLASCFDLNIDILNTLNSPTTIICTHFADVDYYNDHILTHLFQHRERIHEISVGHNPEMDLTDPVNSNWLKTSSSFRKLSKICLGAQTIFTTNVDLQKGAANGASGIVDEIIFDAHQQVTKIGICINNTNNRVVVSKSTYRMDHAKGHHRSKNTFPINLGYAMTAHKSQGATITSKVVLIIREVFCPGLLYVMLSRVSTRQNLTINKTLTPLDFWAIQLPEPAPVNILLQQQHTIHQGQCSADTTHQQFNIQGSSTEVPRN